MRPHPVMVRSGSYRQPQASWSSPIGVPPRYAPENTLAAFDLALDLGCRHLEVDVDVTSDGHIVVMHDDTVDRGDTNGAGPVGSQTLTELRALDAGAWFGAQFAGERIPDVRRSPGALRDKGRLHLHTELKGRAAQLASRGGPGASVRHGVEGHVTVTFRSNTFRLAEIRAYAPELPTGWLVSEVQRRDDRAGAGAGARPTAPEGRQRHARFGAPPACGGVRRYGPGAWRTRR